MKMISQLTRQAMSRHRIVSLKASAPLTTPAAAGPAPAEPVRTLYTPPASSAAPPETVPPRRPAAPLPQVRPRTIYQQLMVSHDRMTDRHVRRT